MKHHYFLIALALCIAVNISSKDFFKKAGKEIKSTTKKATKKIEKTAKDTDTAVKAAAKETKKGVEAAGKGIEQAAKETDTAFKTGAKETEKGVTLAVKETERVAPATATAMAVGVPAAIERLQTQQGWDDVGFGVDKGAEAAKEFGEAMFVAPYVKPGKALKDFKENEFVGAGAGKNIAPGKTATTHIKTSCLIAVKAWVVEPLNLTAKQIDEMTAEEKYRTDIEIIKAGYDKKEWNKALKDNRKIRCNRYLGDWAVYEVTAADNQCIHHDFEVKLTENKKIKIKKTK